MKSTDEVVSMFNSTLVISGKFKASKSQWWNSVCRACRTVRRRAEHQFLKEHAPESDITKLYRSQYNEACVDAAITINKERNQYYHNKLYSVAGNPGETYKTLNHLLDKQYGSNAFPIGSSETAENLKDFFNNELNKMYHEIKY